MLHSPVTRIVLGIIAIIGFLAVLRAKPWQSAKSPNRSRQELTVGFLPVT